MVRGGHSICISLALPPATTSEVPDAGNSNPDQNFRYDAGLAGYIFNLKTTGLTSGSYTVNFVAGTDPAIYHAPFQVK